MASAVIPDRFDVTTLLGSHLGLSMLLPVPYDPMNDFTLNSYLGILPNEAINEMPKLRYFGVGIKGCYNADDGIRSSAFNPRRTNMNLFQPIPIRCRPVDEDLTEAERANYRMRQRKVMADGTECFLYWLKVADFSNEIKFKRINPINGKEEAIELDRANLQPEPVKVSDDKTVTDTAAQIVAYCEAHIHVDASEILEYITREFRGDTRYGKISEVGFFTGVEKVVSGITGNNVPINYTEACNCHIYNHGTWVGSCLTSVGESFDSYWDIMSNGAVSYK